MNAFGLRLFALVACLLLALTACGNKGPLYLPKDDQPEKTEAEAE